MNTPRAACIDLRRASTAGEPAHRGHPGRRPAAPDVPGVPDGASIRPGGVVLFSTRNLEAPIPAVRPVLSHCAARVQAPQATSTDMTLRRTWGATVRSHGPVHDRDNS